MAIRIAGGGCRATDAHPKEAIKKQMASVPATRSGSEDDVKRDTRRIRALVDVTYRCVVRATPAAITT